MAEAEELVYTLHVRCFNCDTTHFLSIIKGEVFGKQKCPNCQCITLEKENSRAVPRPPRSRGRLEEMANHVSSFGTSGGSEVTSVTSQAPSPFLHRGRMDMGVEEGALSITNLSGAMNALDRSLDDVLNANEDPFTRPGVG